MFKCIPHPRHEIEYLSILVLQIHREFLMLILNCGFRNSALDFELVKSQEPNNGLKNWILKPL